MTLPNSIISGPEAASGGGGGVTLDGAYDFGGPGAGRTIIADAGAVEVIGPLYFGSQANIPLTYIDPVSRWHEIFTDPVPAVPFKAAFAGETEVNPSANSTGAFGGFESDLRVTGDKDVGSIFGNFFPVYFEGTNAVSYVENGDFFTYIFGTPVIGDVHNLFAYFELDSGTVTGTVDALNVSFVQYGGSINEGIGIHVRNFHFGGTLTDQYGIKIRDVGGATNNWSIFTGAGLVQFGDSTQVGDGATSNPIFRVLDSLGNSIFNVDTANSLTTFLETFNGHSMNAGSSTLGQFALWTDTGVLEIGDGATNDAILHVTSAAGVTVFSLDVPNSALKMIDVTYGTGVTVEYRFSAGVGGACVVADNGLFAIGDGASLDGLFGVFDAGGNPVLYADSTTDHVIIDGKLTVTGAIDPTSVLLSDPAAGTELFYESNDGQTAPVSGAATGRLRYNDATGTWQQSVQAGPYTDFATNIVAASQQVLGTIFQTSYSTKPRVSNIGHARQWCYTSAKESGAAGLTQIATMNSMTFGQVGSTFALVDDVDGIGMRCQPLGFAATKQVGVRQNPSSETHYCKLRADWYLSVRMKLSSTDLTGKATFVGCAASPRPFPGTGTKEYSVGAGAFFAGVRQCDGENANKWALYIQNAGAAGTIIDTGVACVFDTLYDIEIWSDSVAGLLWASINGSTPVSIGGLFSSNQILTDIMCPYGDHLTFPVATSNNEPVVYSVYFEQN